MVGWYWRAERSSGPERERVVGGEEVPSMVTEREEKGKRVGFGRPPAMKIVFGEAVDSILAGKIKLNRLLFIYLMSSLGEGEGGGVKMVLVLEVKEAWAYSHVPQVKWCHEKIERQTMPASKKDSLACTAQLFLDEECTHGDGTHFLFYQFNSDNI